jgi:hypothetical protein
MNQSIDQSIFALLLYSGQATAMDNKRCGSSRHVPRTPTRHYQPRALNASFGWGCAGENQKTIVFAFFDKTTTTKNIETNDTGSRLTSI